MANKTWTPKEGEKYWTIDAMEFAVFVDEWDPYYFPSQYPLGIYPTRKAALAARKRIREIVKEMMVENEITKG